MKLKLTAYQLKLIREEKAKEETRLEGIPTGGRGWDRIDCEYHIKMLTMILKTKVVNLYREI